MVGSDPGGTRRAGCVLLVDARGLMRSGIGRYLREILSGLFVDPRFSRFVLLGDPTEAGEFLAEHPAAPPATVVRFPYGFYSAAAQAHWAALHARGALRADVAFFPHYDVPLPPLPCPAVVAVQDLTHFKLPELFPAWKRGVAAHVLRRAVHRATRVLVSSRSARDDLVQRHPEVAGKIEMVPLGVAGGFASLPAASHAAGRAVGDLRPYLLTVGNRKPHKNVVTAVEVLGCLRAELPELRLVVVGERFREDDAVRARARTLGLEDAVVETGAVSDAELRGLYAGAEMLLFPSLYEGFGLPVLEAMALGTPVIASDRASIPEVVGGAGMLAGAADVDGMAAAALRLLREPALRNEMVRRGRERAAHLTWERTARHTADVLWEAAAARSEAGEPARGAGNGRTLGAVGSR
jgi:glycosyltransferase involved in cell wall biosynthesis